MLIGLSYFPGVTIFSFAGSLLVLAFVTVLAGTTQGNTMLSRDSLLLGGVMMNAFCAAVIMFLISMTRSFQVQHILYWLMGDLATMQKEQMPILLLVLPCFVVIFILARPMNLLLLGRETAAAMGINVKRIVLLLLVITSLMVSIIVSLSGLVGFVGLVIPHIFRLLLGPDHRLLVPSCLLGGAAYLILCDLLARILPASGELPVGIITALIGAPLFIVLLLRDKP
jgi:iron complex transport system permease protein